MQQFRPQIAIILAAAGERHFQFNEEMRKMAKTYADIQKEIAALQKAAEAARQKEVAGVIDRIKVAIATYQLSARDLGLAGRPVAAPKRRKARKTAKPAAAVRYRDEAGHTWSGRGRRPGWFTSALAAGKKAEDLRA
jgi:DNA-binding protein H-NS